MFSFLRKGLLLLLVLSLWLRPARAQRVTIDSVVLEHTQGLYLPTARRALVSTIVHDDGATYLRHYLLSPALRQQRQQLRLPGHYQLSNTASSRAHVLYQLHRRGSDTLLSLVVDTLGRVVAQRRESSRWIRWQDLHGELAPHTAGFLTTESTLVGGEVLFRFTDWQLRPLWQHRFRSAEGQVDVAPAILDSTHLWLLVTNNARSPRATTTAYCLQLATGRVLCRLPLDYHGERRRPDVGVMGPGHSLLVAGCSSARNRLSHRSPGHLFYTQLYPDSTCHDRLVTGSAEPHLPLVRHRHVLWQTLRPAPDGSVLLVGETYTSTSFGTHLALDLATGLATVGLGRVNKTTLRPREVVAVHLSATGQVDDARVLPLPDTSSYTLHGYWPARRMAQAAQQAGSFRLRGLAPDSQRVVLRTGRRVLTMSLQSGQIRTVRPIPPKGQLSDVWVVQPGFLLLYHQQPKPARIELERLAY
ncbi:hypothetical protein [Hymenobacter chitinivorans]|uniref:Uncharacterized protein n=1 Tax=Hymenobacter chitinivorans DSM 11115 TaxID=1121954 RepID=A0A2M9B5P7_9BACT|nr:hypothetical protein [Hymenobacter chitinivorans]PJJ53262.1 hypothetical protein CLV45_3922 [Hymenobacter chitinivorans DSM 11115]